MLKKIQHIGLWAALFCSVISANAQVAMPDTVCIGTSRIYKVNDGATLSSYTWALNGVRQNSTKNELVLVWNTPGDYTITVQEHAQNGCDGDIQTGTVHVLTPPVPKAGDDILSCFGAIPKFNGSGGTAYRWFPSTYLSNPFIANPTAAIPLPGVYKYVLEVTDIYGCKSLQKDTVVIKVLPPVRVFAGNDTTIAVNQSLQLNAVDMSNAGFVSYSWSPSSGLTNTAVKNPVLNFSSTIGNNSIVYRVAAKTADGCLATDDIAIKVFSAADIYMPNAFTPDNKGVNNTIKPILVGIRELKYFVIYNRYGQEVFRTSVAGNGWDGNFKGLMQNSGTFVWIAEGVDYMGNTLKRKGTVMLIR